jgi:hypothetical protein
VLIENRAEVAEIIATNYAASINADVILVEPVERDEIFPIARQLQEWAKNRSS